jgi:pimeloyl-ACP methyl ester carboxylesterase
MNAPMPTQQTMFKTPEGQARYFAAYDATLALWPTTVEPIDLPTRFGPTHVNACGPEDAPPLVLLPGAAISSTMWYPNVGALSRTYRVYAPDIIGEMGKSVSTRPIAKPADYVDWLIDVFDGLRLGQAHVVGISLGGYLALKLAHSAPERVAKLVLLSPATLLAIRPQFYFRIAAAILVPFLSAETRQTLFLGTASSNAAPAIKQLMTPTDFRYKMSFPKVNTDDELRQIQASTLLLLGEHEIIYNPRTALKRATKLIPRLEADIIPGAGHALNLDQPERVNQRILEFLGKDDGSVGGVETS